MIYTYSSFYDEWGKFCKVLCYLEIKWELFIITYNPSKHKQKLVFGGSYRVNNCRKLEQFVITSGISSSLIEFCTHIMARTLLNFLNKI